MIVTKIFGGLGNQMFQYAVGRAVTLSRKKELKLDISDLALDPLRRYDLHVFNIIENVATQKEVTELRGKKRSKLENYFWHLLSPSKLQPRVSYVKDQSVLFQPNILNSPDGSYLDGYWQSEKYFIKISSTIREDFTWKHAPNKANQMLLDKIMASDAISLHVRRGDYVASAATNAYHGTTPIQYYQEAIERMKMYAPNGKIFIFSDDQQWVKDNLQFDLPSFFVDINDTFHADADLRLMSHCKHHVLANSTFSWWGAWLGERPGQHVIAPKEWFKNGQDSSDIVPDRWERI